MRITRKKLLFVACLAGLLAFFRFASPASKDAPFIPKSDAEVLETLPSQPQNVRARRLLAMRRRLDGDPKNVQLATLVAQENIEEARERGDPRYLGYAEAALAPWWDANDAPAEVLVLRATIRQSSHDFDGALADLDRVLEAAEDAQALLTRSVILTVQGKYAEARRTCERLAPLTRPLTSEVCLSTLDSLQGEAKAAYARLSRAVAHARLASTSPEKSWALSSLAEIALRAGDVQSAERHFRQVLAVEPLNAYVLGALADLLLDLGRAGEVTPLLQKQTGNDALLLRLAIAESRTRAPLATEHTHALRQRFEASRERGDTVHRREESRFQLVLEKSPRVALELARANWAVQHEPWDARVLLEAALEAHQPQAAASVVAAVDTGMLREPKIMDLVQRVRGLKQ